MRRDFSASIECFNDCKFNFSAEYDRMMESLKDKLTETKETLAKRMQDDNDTIDKLCECLDVYLIINADRII